jgi:hypothetical protein
LAIGSQALQARRSDKNTVDLETERERERKLGGVVLRGYNSGGSRNNIFCFEGSQAVLASPTGRSEACVQDEFKILILMELEGLHCSEI